MTFPTMEQVKAASHEQLARWYRFLPIALDNGEHKVMERITRRFRLLGGFTLAISKKIGWD